MEEDWDSVQRARIRPLPTGQLHSHTRGPPITSNKVILNIRGIFLFTTGHGINSALQGRMNFKFETVINSEHATF